MSSELVRATKGVLPVGPTTAVADARSWHGNMEATPRERRMADASKDWALAFFPTFHADPQMGSSLPRDIRTSAHDLGQMLPFEGNIGQGFGSFPS